MEYDRYTSGYRFSKPKEPTKVEDLHARGFSRRHRRLADGRTVIIKYSDSMRVGRDSRYNRANVPVMTEMYEMIRGKNGAPDTFRKLPPNEFLAVRRELEEGYKTTHLAAEDIAQHSTGRAVTRIRRRGAG